LWHFPRQRLEAEAIRDSALAVSGLLNLKMEGPSVFPEVPAGMEAAVDETDRRSSGAQSPQCVHFVRRNTRYPLMEVFDMPDTHESCGRRNLTTTAPQALALLNDGMTLQWAQAFAARVFHLRDRMCRRKSARPIAWPTRVCRIAREAAVGRSLNANVSCSRLVSRREKLALPTGSGEQSPEPADRAAGAALVDFCHVLLTQRVCVSN